MIPLDWSVLFLSGMLVVLLNWKELKKLPSLVSNRFFRRLFVWYFWFIVGTLPFYLFYPDWMWAYFKPATSVPSVLGALFFYLFTFMIFVAGYLSMALLVKEKNKKVQAGGAIFLLIGALVLAVMAVVGLWEEFWTVTSYEGFHSGVKEAVKYKELFWKLYAVAGVIMVGSFNWFFSLKDKFEKKDRYEKEIDSGRAIQDPKKDSKKDLII